MPNVTCSIDGCDKPIYVKIRQLCSGHYQKFLRRGSTDPVFGTIKERFFGKVDQQHPSGCWIWLDYIKPNGYGSMWNGERKVYAHRLSWELFRGPIPDGMQIDHLCRNRRCVNPNHLEPVTMTENLRRGYGWSGLNARKTHCPRGHEYTDENTARNNRGERLCKECRRITNREQGIKRKARAA